VEFDGEAVGEPLNATELARVKGRLTPEMKAKLKARAKLLANKEADDAELKSLELEEQLEAERQAELDQQVRGSNLRIFASPARRRCTVHGCLSGPCVGDGAVLLAGGLADSPQIPVFLVCRHVNSTSSDSNHGCQGGISQLQITFMGVDNTSDKQTTALINPHGCVWAL